MNPFLSSRLRSFKPYTPGEQRRDKKYIKLNTNESPYSPSPAAIAAATGQALADLRLYPDPTCSALKAEIADLYGVSPENVFVSNGSDETLYFAFLAYCENGVVFPEVTYGFYEVYANLCGLSYEKIPLRAGFELDISDYIGKNKTVVIANPNAPTGLYLTQGKIETLVKSNPNNVVLVDEAYIDFGGESCAPLVKEYKNLLCVQTFSKSRSLAGARLGFAIADSELIAGLEIVKYSFNPYNVNRLTQLIGLGALSDKAYFDDCLARVIATREKTKAALTARGFEVTDSLANFLFCRTAKMGGRALYEKLREKGILVRHFRGPLTSDWIRVSIGSDADMEAFLAAIDLILKG